MKRSIGPLLWVLTIAIHWLAYRYLSFDTLRPAELMTQAGVQIAFVVPQTPSPVVFDEPPRQKLDNGPPHSASVSPVPGISQAVDKVTAPSIAAPSAAAQYPVVAHVEAFEVEPTPALVDTPELIDGAEQEIAPNFDYPDSDRVDRRITALDDLSPVYPVEAFSERREGSVVIEIRIGAGGRVDALIPITATPGFVESALSALKTIRFKPAVVHGLPSNGRMFVEIRYTLFKNE